MISSMRAIAFGALAFGVLILLCLTVLWGTVQRSASMDKETEYSYSDLFDKVQSGEVIDAVIQGSNLRGHLKASPKDEFHTTLPANDEDLLRAMIAARVNFSIKAPQNNALIPLLINVGPFVVLILANILVVPPFWVIFRKAGFQPALSLLMLVPMANLILLYLVALSEWRSAPG
jgi:ATP-dependent Zn protease